MVFLNGVTKDMTSGIPFSIVAEPDTKWNLYITGLSQEEQLDFDKVLKEQQPENLSQTQKFKDGVSLYQMAQTANVRGEYVFSIVESKIKDLLLNFHFKKFGDRLVLSDLSQRGNRTSEMSFGVTVHHYSVREDKSAFSVLLQLEDRKNNRTHLYAYTFTKYDKDKSILEQTLSTVYEYLFGSGVKMAWDSSKDLQFNICESGMPTLDKIAQESILVWNEPLKDRMTLKADIVSSCPPFNDLNSLNVYHIDDWVEILGEAHVSAFVMGVPNYYKDQLIDADMFYLKSDVAEAYHLSGQDLFRWTETFVSRNKEAFKRVYGRTIKHETGHVLGLGHKMDGTPSIMSYDGITELQDYDTKAVQALYPKTLIDNL